MKAFELQNAVGLENLKLVERDVPKPGPNEVVLRMKAASLNYRDLANVTGGRYKLPYVPLSDGCGVVEEVGAGVTRVKKGDRVAPSFFQKWLSGPVDPVSQGTSLGGPIDGCLSEYMCLHEDGMSKVPDYLTDEEVATLPCAGLTAWRALVVEGDIKPGDIVVVQGTGGVSIFALQFAKAAGATVIATSSSDEKLDRVKKLGADHLINYKATPEWGTEVRKLTGGRGADHIVEVGGAGTFNQSLIAAKTGGHVSVIGILAGFNQDVPIALIMGSNLKIKGITVGSRLMAEQMCAGMAASRIRPVISDTLPFTDAVKALELMKNHGHFGKICLKIS
ncbi:MAG: NAD(P)-dependent alcohol dehydrogenase [Alphaproteobacteria bacterium]|nr:NAD(P)-dependent alcohol dehydrogenase [Alphaproteobacteria bacterium]